MGGNLWEWNEQNSGVSRVLPGSSWLDDPGFLQSSVRNFYLPADENFVLLTGFRVAGP